jgi:regulator of sigma E protease
MLPLFPLYLFAMIPGFIAVAVARWAAARVLGMRGVRFGFGGAIENPEAAARWRRALVVVAGIAASYLVAVVVFVAAFLAGAGGTLLTQVTVLPNRPAAHAGMQTGDRVRSVAGREVATWDELAKTVSEHPGEPVEVVVARGDETVRFTVTPDADRGKGKIGIAPTGPTRPLGGAALLARAIVQPVQVLVDIVKGVLDMLVGKQSTELTGPVGIVSAAGQAASTGAAATLFFIASLLAYVWPGSAILAIAAMPRRPRAAR